MEIRLLLTDGSIIHNLGMRLLSTKQILVVVTDIVPDGKPTSLPGKYIV